MVEVDVVGGGVSGDGWWVQWWMVMVWRCQ